MTTLVDISDLLAKVFGSSIGPVPFFVLPALALGIGVAVWFLKANVKKEVVVDASKASKLSTAKEWLKDKLARDEANSGNLSVDDEGEKGGEGKVTLDDGLGIDHSKVMETEAEKRLESLRRDIMDDFSKLGLLGHGNGGAKNYLGRVVGYSFALALMNSRPRFDGISFDIVSKQGDLDLEMPDGKVGSLVFEPMNRGESLKELEARIAKIEAIKEEKPPIITKPAPPVTPIPLQEDAEEGAV